MNLFEPFNLVLCFVVAVFWLAVVTLSRARGRSLSPRLLSLPLFFVVLGLLINRYRSPIGTYVVVMVHVLMLPALFRAAKSPL